MLEKYEADGVSWLNFPWWNCFYHKTFPEYHVSTLDIIKVQNIQEVQNLVFWS